ncbi:hypothetical protein OEOE_1577 [Oenococcus oeni PSU-1]|uniref:Uncharacterized protein n=1 Tax=Oenococcus oeni (strain ATCC BAA-331 / PSU-1) TaxID=203123 RepID=Q04DP3_OENOB|nr:hypothetical protein OEOE_1577 [Oenococcus oeni PSU-1]
MPAVKIILKKWLNFKAKNSRKYKNLF